MGIRAGFSSCTIRGGAAGEELWGMRTGRRRGPALADLSATEAVRWSVRSPNVGHPVGCPEVGWGRHDQNTPWITEQKGRRCEGMATAHQLSPTQG